jgi:hypothetical protein
MLRRNRVRRSRWMAGATGLEPATSGVTGRRSNQLSYAPGVLDRDAHSYRSIGRVSSAPGGGSSEIERPCQSRLELVDCTHGKLILVRKG